MFFMIWHNNSISKPKQNPTHPSCPKRIKMNTLSTLTKDNSFKKMGNKKIPLKIYFNGISFLKCQISIWVVTVRRLQALDAATT